MGPELILFCHTEQKNPSPNRLSRSMKNCGLTLAKLQLKERRNCCIDLAVLF